MRWRNSGEQQEFVNAIRLTLKLDPLPQRGRETKRRANGDIDYGRYHLDGIPVHSDDFTHGRVARR